MLLVWSSILHVSIRRHDSGSRFFRRDRTKETISLEKVKTQEATSQESRDSEGHFSWRDGNQKAASPGEAGLKRPLFYGG